MTLHRTEIPSTASFLKTWILLADWLAGRAPETGLPRRFGPCPHSHQTTIMIMQMHSEMHGALQATEWSWALWGHRILPIPAHLGFLSWYYLYICLETAAFFKKIKNVWAEARRLYWRKCFSQGLNGYRSWERKALRMLSVSLQWITIAFLDLLEEDISLSHCSHWRTWTWTNLSCLSQQRPFRGPLQGGFKAITY